jgi:hypothetical protein
MTFQQHRLYQFPVECGFIQHVGEGGEAGLGKKDTGYLSKAFMVARPFYPAQSVQQKQMCYTTSKR